MKYGTLYLFLFFTINLSSQSELRKCIFFENNRFELSAENQKIILEHILALDTNQYVQLRGFANHFGDYNSNLELSKKRAKSIEAIIVAGGFPKQKIELNFQGEKLANPNQNSIIESRRVDIISYTKPRLEKKECNREKEFAYFNINPTRDTIIVCKEGTRLTYSANSLVYENTDKIANGKIELKVQEFYKKSEFVLNKLSTMTQDNQLLESGGMVHIEASESGNKLVLAKNKDLKIEFPFKNKKAGMQLFAGTETKNDVLWKLNETEDSIYSIVDQMPEFKGGDDAMMEYLRKSIIYPNKAMENNVSGTVMVNFVVNENGSIGKERILNKKLGFGLEEEAIRVVKSMPKWKPGKLGGREVKVYFDLPISFSLDDKVSEISSSFDGGMFQFNDPNDRKKTGKENILVQFDTDSAGLIQNVTAKSKKENKDIEELAISSIQNSNLINKSLRNTKNLSIPVYCLIAKDESSTEFSLPSGWRYQNQKEINTAKKVTFENKLEKNKEKVTADEIGTYILSSQTLGWINCDRFLNIPKMDLVIKTDNESGFVAIVFDKINGVINSYEKTKHRVFKNIAKDEPITIVAVKKENEKSYLSINKLNTNISEYTIQDFKEVSLDDIKLALQKLDQ
jgi:TonB family protein